MSYARDIQEEDMREVMAAIRALPVPEGRTLIEKLRDVVTRETAGVIDEVLVDLYTARITVQVYDALSPRSREAFDRMTVTRACGICLKVAAKVSR